MTYRSRFRRNAGMTLMEIMIVIVIIALATGGMTYAVGALGRTKLRAGAMHLVAAARYARHRALTSGKTVRVVIDIDTSLMSIEEASGGITLADPNREDGSSDDEAINPWESAQEMMAHPDRPATGTSAFGPIINPDGSVNSRYTDIALEGCRVISFRTPHEPTARERGRVSFYYFPNGTGEHTYVVLSDASDRKLTVELDPLAARGQIHPGELERIEHRAPRDPG
jgi:prepilin-type N-terminal cleavage/methylation domain-containing protein